MAKKIKKKGFMAKDGNILRSKKSKLWLPTLILLIPQKKNITLVRSRILIAIKKATMLATAPSQKTSIGFGNFYIGN